MASNLCRENRDPCLPNVKVDGAELPNISSFILPLQVFFILSSSSGGGSHSFAVSLCLAHSVRTPSLGRQRE